MQLRNARLCLDCEEVHDAAHCPACASESFAFITRWVPAPGLESGLGTGSGSVERRERPRTPEPPSSPEALDTYRQMLAPASERQSTWVKRGAVGLALFGLAGWAWRQQTRRAGPDGSRSSEGNDVRSGGQQQG